MNRERLVQSQAKIDQVLDKISARLSRKRGHAHIERAVLKDLCQTLGELRQEVGEQIQFIDAERALLERARESRPVTTYQVPTWSMEKARTGQGVDGYDHSRKKDVLVGEVVCGVQLTLTTDQPDLDADILIERRDAGWCAVISRDSQHDADILVHLLDDLDEKVYVEKNSTTCPVVFGHPPRKP